MEKSKKIKLVTFSPHPNFGTCLQSYALSSILCEMGYDVEFIYNDKDFPQRGTIGTIKDVVKAIIPQSLIESFWRWKRKRAMQNNTPTTIGNKIHVAPDIITIPNEQIKYFFSFFPFYEPLRKILKYRSKQWKKVYSFTFLDGNYKMKRLYTIDQYEKIVDDADLFITGSDQIWNPYCCGFNPMMFLEFVKGRKKCIAYSSSISIPSFPPEVEERAKRCLQHFQHIAVREQSSVELLNHLLDRNDVQLVVDPTCLICKERWLEFGNRAKIEFNVPDKYIFCYFIGNRKNDYTAMVEDVKAKTGIYDVITIDCINCNINYGNGILYKDGGPYEFIYLLSHASFICMDSYHATLFAMKFNIDFVHILKNKDDKSHLSQNDRMRDLLLRYHLLNKLYDENSTNWLIPINWDYINKLANQRIAESMYYLRQSL